MVFCFPSTGDSHFLHLSVSHAASSHGMGRLRSSLPLRCHLPHSQLSGPVIELGSNKEMTQK
jgi:hypothetical protein